MRSSVLLVAEDVQPLVASLNKRSIPCRARDCDGTTVPAGFEGMHIFEALDVAAINDYLLRAATALGRRDPARQEAP
jgi:hypothetical protein